MSKRRTEIRRDVLPQFCVGRSVPCLLKCDFAGQFLPLLAGRPSRREKRQDRCLPAETLFRFQRGVWDRARWENFVVVIVVALDGLADESQVVRTTGDLAFLLSGQQ